MHSTARKPYCLASVGDLDSLELRFHYTERLSVWGPYEDAVVPYSELGRDHIWQTYIETYWNTYPKIKRLALINVATTPAQLKATLEGSKGLEHLELENIRLTKGSWFDAFEEIARVWKLSIVDIGLKGEFSSWWECWQADATAAPSRLPASFPTAPAPTRTVRPQPLDRRLVDLREQPRPAGRLSLGPRFRTSGRRRPAFARHRSASRVVGHDEQDGRRGQYRR